MLSPDNSQAKMVPSEQANDAQDAGWTPASKMVNPDGEHKWVPNEEKDGLTSKGWTPLQPDGSFVIQPAENESFEDTMKRAANAGKWLSQHPEVSKPLMANQVKKGLQDAPLAMAAGPAMAAGQLGAAAGVGELLPQIVPAGIAGAKAVTAWAARNPTTAKITYELLKAALTAGAVATGTTAALKIAGKVIGQ